MASGCVQSGHSPGAFSRSVLKIGRNECPSELEDQSCNMLHYNDLYYSDCVSLAGTDPAFKGARESQGALHQIASSKRVPYAGTGG